jgi:hypothetical protein
MDRIRVCISDMGIRPPVPVQKDWCLEVVGEVPKPKPEHRYFSTKAFWFRMDWERDVNSAYLQIGLKEGLVKLYYGNREIKSVAEFKALSKMVAPWKYVVTDQETGWAGLLYKSDRPQVGKPKYCYSLEECTDYEGHLYKRWTKFIPQLLMGWLKKHLGHPLIDYVASVTNSKLRQVCAPSKECVAHVHDGLVMTGGPGPKLPFDHKVEQRAGWSWAGIVAPGDPPRFWGFMPNRIIDIIIINKALTESETPQEVMERIEHLSLWPDIFWQTIDKSPPGLVDLGTALAQVKPDITPPDEFIWDLVD